MTLAEEGGLRRIDVSTIERPVLNGTWTLPMDVVPAAAAGPILLAVRGTERRQLAVFRLDASEPVTVDWLALDIITREQVIAYNAAVKRTTP